MIGLFDLSPLQSWHFVVFLAVFVISFASVEILVRLRPAFWRVPNEKGKGVVYAGLPLVTIVTATAMWFLGNTYLALGLLLASFFIAYIGSIDEHMPIPALRQLFWQIVIAGTAVAFGWTIPYVSNPFAEGIMYLNQLQMGLWVFPGSVLAVLWILLCMNAINWLDGLDGLAGGVVTVALFALVAISLLPSVQDSTTLLLALIGAAGLLGFTLWNFFPAKAYLGTSGSWFLGLYVALVAMYGGGKMVTALLVLALPILDALYVIVRRIMSGQKPWQGDTVSHMHHRLLSAGLSPQTIAAIFILGTVALAVTGVIASTAVKILLMITLAGGIVLSLVWDRQKKHNKIPS